MEHSLEAFDGLDWPLALSACKTLGLVSVTGPALRAVLVRPDVPPIPLGSVSQPGVLGGSDWAVLWEAPAASVVSTQRSPAGSLLSQVLPGVWRRMDDGLATNLMVVLVSPEVLTEALAAPASEPPEGVRVAVPPDVDPEAEVSGGEVFVRPVCAGDASAVFVRWGAVASMSPRLAVLPVSRSNRPPPCCQTDTL